MFSSRQLQAIVLLVAVMAAGFVLFDTFFVQEAAATSCQIGYILCDLKMWGANKICNHHGWSSAECANATGEAVRYCAWVMNVICQGG